MSRPLTILATLTGSLLVVLALSLPTLSPPAGTVGDVPAPDAARAPVPAPSPSPPRAAASAAQDPDPAPPSPAPVAAPSGLRIPTIGVDARVVPVGLEDDGGMEIPEDVATGGWYEPGVAPGDDGSAVIAGHVDSRTQGRGAFFDLVDLDVGDTATVTHEDGSTSAWRVTGRSSYPKDEAPLPELFRRGGGPQLALITCGGAFDAGARSYAENVVVILTPA